MKGARGFESDLDELLSHRLHEWLRSVKCALHGEDFVHHILCIYLPFPLCHFSSDVVLECSFHCWKLRVPAKSVTTNGLVVRCCPIHEVVASCV